MLDSCTKTAFSYDNIFYQQCDGVSIGFSLAPLLPNIILTEFEKVFVTPVMDSGILKFYCRYADDTLVLVEEDQIDKTLKVFNSFHNNLQYIVEKFKNEDLHFLDLKIIVNSEINIYVKIPIVVYKKIPTRMNHSTRKLHELKHFTTELIKYVAMSVCSRN